MKEMKTQETNRLIFEEVAALASTFASPARLRILYILAQDPRSVDSISQITGESIANTSQHLQKLLHEGLVLVRKEKLSRIYSLSDELIILLIEDLFNLTEKIAPRFSFQIEDLKQVDLLSIIEDLQSKKAIMLDVRDEYESSYSPIEDAISVPLSLLKEKTKTLKKNKTYYIFCRGRACDLASEGVNILRNEGFKAFRLKESPLIIKHQLKKEKIDE
jgi:DNA-binding transcriptional ArsR family regulator